MRSDKHKLTFRRRLLLTLPWAVLTLGADWLTKQAVLSSFELFEVRPVTSFFNLVLVENQGAAFSLLSGEGSYQGLKMALLALLAMVPLVYFFYEAKLRRALAALGLILGGGLGNIHDRLSYNAVVDFLDFHLQDRHWPAFNVADAAIVAGVGLLLWASFRECRPKK
ncbi:MAG: signal peptidase II [Deltaproteobacteria bacterium]|nr:signal peptidase II [Deltaproteobacteria bacterium]